LSNTAERRAPAGQTELVERAVDRARSKANRFHWDPLGEQSSPPLGPSPATAHHAPVTILLSEDDKTLFRDVHDPRARIVRPGEPTPGPPDVLVVTRADRTDLGVTARNVPPEVWARIASGAARVVLDGSGEGNRHNAGHTRTLHQFLRDKGLTPGDAAFVTQDRGYEAAYRAHCDATGLGTQRMQIWIHDLYIQHLFAPFHDRGEQAFNKRLEVYTQREIARPRRFVCLNNTVRPARALFLMRLLKDELWDHGSISVGKLPEKESDTFARALIRKSLRDLPELTDLAAELDTQIDRLRKLSATYVGGGPEGSRNFRKKLLRASPLGAYERSWFTVVTESDVSDRLHRITEKPFKPLLAFHPLIILGSVQSLRLLRAYGFETFPGWFDEAYDEDVDLRTRFESVYRQTVRLCRLDQAELARLDKDSASTVIFNAYWGFVELPRLFRTHIDAALIDRLIGFVNAPAKV
jgi:hypothetical protein